MQVWCLLQCLSADTSRRRGEEEKGLLPDRLFSRPSPKISGYTYIPCPTAPGNADGEGSQKFGSSDKSSFKQEGFFRCKVLPSVTSPAIRMTSPILPAPENQLGSTRTTRWGLKTHKRT